MDKTITEVLQRLTSEEGQKILMQNIEEVEKNGTSDIELDYLCDPKQPRQDEIDLLNVIANWIDNIDESTVGLPYFPSRFVYNSGKPIPTLKEVVKYLRHRATIIEHPTYVCVYRAICGWQTAVHAWDSEDGYYEIMQTGFGPYGHSKEGYDMAVDEAKGWAESDQIEFKQPPEWTPNE